MAAPRSRKVEDRDSGGPKEPTVSAAHGCAVAAPIGLGFRGVGTAGTTVKRGRNLREIGGVSLLRTETACSSNLAPKACTGPLIAPERIATADNGITNPGVKSMEVVLGLARPPLVFREGASALHRRPFQSPTAGWNTGLRHIRHLQ